MSQVAEVSITVLNVGKSNAVQRRSMEGCDLGLKFPPLDLHML